MKITKAQQQALERQKFLDLVFPIQDEIHYAIIRNNRLTSKIPGCTPRTTLRASANQAAAKRKHS